MRTAEFSVFWDLWLILMEDYECFPFCLAGRGWDFFFPKNGSLRNIYGRE